MSLVTTEKVINPTKISSLDESIVVVPRQKLFPAQAISGLSHENLTDYELAIRHHHEFMLRREAEENPAYKQIIPYMIFTNKDRYFVMQRRNSASESRLRNKYSLGIGGHLRKEDVQGTDLASWGMREFREEIAYEGNFTMELIGILNDESNFVGQVHTGIVFLITGDSDKIAVRSELKSGVLWSLDSCRAVYDAMETWSQIVFDYLKAR